MKPTAAQPETKAHTPWAISDDGERIFATDCPQDGGDIICEWPDAERSNARWPANAALIVRAVNSYAELLNIALSIIAIDRDDTWETDRLWLLAKAIAAVKKAEAA